MVFNFTELPKELQLRVAEIMEPSSLMTLRCTSHGLKDLIDKHRFSLLKDILNGQYPELRIVLGQTGSKLRVLDDGKVAKIDDLLEVTPWERRIGHISFPDPMTVEDDEAPNWREGCLVEMAIWACRKVAARWRNWSFLAWSYDVQSTSWGYLVLMRMIRAIMDEDIATLESQEFISRSGENKSHFRLMSACDVSWATSTVKCYRINEVRCALLLLWRLRWRYGRDGELRTGNVERVRLVEEAPPQTREVFQILLRKLITHNGYALPYSQLLDRCDTC